MSLKHSEHAELVGLRGMSEPFAFTFNLLDRKGKVMLVHSVIFSSFEMSGDGEASINLCTTDRDPRVAAFTEYVWSNFLKDVEDKRKKAEATIKALEGSIDRLRRELDSLKHRVERTNSKTHE